MDTLLPLLSRVLIAPLVAAGAGWLATKYGITFTTEQQKELVEKILTVVVPTMLAVYGLAHRVADRKLNPADTADKHLVEPGKNAVENVKSAEKSAKRDELVGDGSGEALPPVNENDPDLRWYREPQEPPQD